MPNYTDLQSSVEQIMGSEGGPNQLPIPVSELPDLIPSRSVARVRFTIPARLKEGDVIVLEEDGANIVRRFLKLSRGEMVTTVDWTGELLSYPPPEKVPVVEAVTLDGQGLPFGYRGLRGMLGKVSGYGTRGVLGPLVRKF